MSKVFEHGCCIAENEAVIVHDHYPQDTRRLPAVLRCAIRNNVGALDLSYRRSAVCSANAGRPTFWSSSV